MLRGVVIPSGSPFPAPPPPLLTLLVPSPAQLSNPHAPRPPSPPLAAQPNMHSRLLSHSLAGPSTVLAARPTHRPAAARPAPLRRLTVCIAAPVPPSSRAAAAASMGQIVPSMPREEQELRVTTVRPAAGTTPVQQRLVATNASAPSGQRPGGPPDRYNARPHAAFLCFGGGPGASGRCMPSPGDWGPIARAPRAELCPPPRTPRRCTRPRSSSRCWRPTPTSWWC